MKWIIKFWNWMKSLVLREQIISQISRPKYSHKREIARRKRQLEKGQLTVSNGLKLEGVFND